jgi:hypothetical protein
MADAEVQKVKDAVSLAIGRKVSSSQAKLILEKIGVDAAVQPTDESDDEMEEQSVKPVDDRAKVLGSKVRINRALADKLEENSIGIDGSGMVDRGFSSGSYKPSPSERMKAINVIRKIDGQIAFLQRKRLDLMQLYRIVIEDDVPKRSRFPFMNSDDEDDLP